MVRFNAALKLVNENAPYALGFSTDDGLTYGNGQVILRHAPVLPFVLKAGLSGARAGCVVAPTGSIAVAIKKNGSSVGTINIAAGATTATFTFAGDVSFTTSDTLTVTAPASADVTLAGRLREPARHPAVGHGRVFLRFRDRDDHARHRRQ